jgi:MFS family permease
MAVFSLGLSAKLVMRLGIKTPLVMGLAFATLGLVLFARAPVEGSFALDVLPGMLLLGLGAGIAFNPVLMAAMNDVEQRDSGLASGIVNTAFMMGGALGLAVLASLAASRSHDVTRGGGDIQTALAQGYGSAFLAGAVFAALAAGCGAFFLRARQVPAHAGE